MAHAHEPAAPRVFTASLLRALLTEIARFPPPTRARGQRYAATGRVGSLTFDGYSVFTVVVGTEPYDTEWEWEGDAWYPSCTCPAAPYCKHAYALACCIVAHCRGNGNFTDHRLAELMPPELVVAVVPATPRVTGHETGRLQDPPPSSALLRLRSARQVWEREHAFSRLVVSAPVLQPLSPYAPPFSRILTEPDPDLLCWHLAREIAQRANGWLPPALEPYRDRPDLATQYVERVRSGLEKELIAWADRQRSVTRRKLRVVFGLDRDEIGQPVVTVKARLTTSRAADAPRTMQQLQQLRGEVRHNPGLLSAEEATLLEWLADYGIGGQSRYDRDESVASPSALRYFIDRIGGFSISSWAEELPADLAARAGVAPGAPVRVASEAVRLLPLCTSRNGDVWVELRFLWPDGREQRLDEMLYLSNARDRGPVTQSVVLAGGKFAVVAEEPPLALVEQFSVAGGLPLPPEERSSLIGRLAASFPHLRESLAAHTRVHGVTPVVALDLRDGNWLHLRLIAHTGSRDWQPGMPLADGVVAFEYTPEGRWVRSTDPRKGVERDMAVDYDAIAQSAERGDGETLRSSIRDGAPPDQEVWLEIPDARDVEPAVVWLEATGASPGAKQHLSGRKLPPYEDRDIGWWMPANHRRMSAFAELWERRPEGVSYFGTERVRRLLTGTDRVLPRLRIQSSGTDWFSVSAQWESEGLRLTDADLAKLRAAKTRFVKLPSGWVRSDAGDVRDESAELLADLGIEPGEGEQRLTLWQLAGVKPESLAALEHLGVDAAVVRELRKRVELFTGLPAVPTPAGLVAELRPYQKEGLDFLAYTSSLGVGAVLADDMGLGKTVQALAWMAHLREQEPDGGPILVVCPASVMHNWVREAERFTPGLRVLLLGSGRARHGLRAEIPRHDLIVTNYALLRQDIEEWEKVDLRAAVLDEAQNIKNPDAAVTRAALALRARHRLALTGTPLENRALDLWSIMSFVNPGYLGSRSRFAASFDRPDTPAHYRTLLAAKLRPVLVRRTKSEVAKDLPERIEERLDCELTTGQRQLYLAELRRSRALVDKLSGTPGALAKNKITILAALTRLRQICCHPALAGGKASLGSGKFQALFELLEPLLEEGHKVLLFSQFVECLKLVSQNMRLLGIPHHILTGQTQTKKREEVVAAFQNDPKPSVFLISLKAGGTGLNLTSASYVVLFDPWWNPAVEAQAIDRSHRIGQDRTVIAYRMLAQGTIEQKIWEMQQHKASLVRDILGERGFAGALSREDLGYLLDEADDLAAAME